jgi:predicted aspartyl protease
VGRRTPVLPEEVWKRIGLKPLREHEFVLADGTVVKRKVSECYIVLPQGEAHTPVVLGEADDQGATGRRDPRDLGLNT